MKISENEIRAVRKFKDAFAEGYYWVHIELFIDGKWIEPFIVNEDKLDWHINKDNFYGNEENMKEFIKRQLKTINRLFSEGYKLVSYEKYKEVIHRYHYPTEYEPDVVYLKKETLPTKDDDGWTEEDERIRKELITYLQDRKSNETYGEIVAKYNRFIAWLENYNK